jgi:hypothetical protein
VKSRLGAPKIDDHAGADLRQHLGEAARRTAGEQIDLVGRPRRAAAAEPRRHDLVVLARASERVGDVAEERVHAHDQHRVFLARHRRLHSAIGRSGGQWATPAR